MKRNISVSLGGMVFHLAEDAYHRLSAYINKLEIHFRSDKDRREIMADIESRMAEHFKERLTSPDMVITLSEVNRVIGIMGEPSDMESNDDTNTTGSFHGGERVKKRLYRDPDGSVIAGVCSGLGYYWNIEAALIRVLFIIIFFWGGGGLLIYIILWIAIPKALTVAEKLEMKGEPVNAENIGRSFQDE
ncbi:MAG TPA: PspC domain-containing protein [Tenuifilaceae bacterium]|nr:PspC domain-containing protein [Tenuifilaceae bacterium]